MVLLIVVLTLLVRVGCLAVAAWWFGYQALESHLVTLRPGDWYFSSALVALLVLGLLIAWSWRASLAQGPALDARMRGSR